MKLSTFMAPLRAIFSFLFIVVCLNGFGQTQPWLYDLGTGTGSYTTTGSSDFLPDPPAGTDFVRVRDNGAVYLQNAYNPFGSGSCVRLKTSVNANFTKFSVYNYPLASNTFMLKFDVQS